MASQEADILTVLGIAKATLTPGTGVSLSKAMQEANVDFFELTTPVVLDGLKSHPALVEDWVQFSQGKRTSGGWYLNESDNSVGNLDGEKIECESLNHATAEYIVRELQYWWSVR